MNSNYNIISFQVLKQAEITGLRSTQKTEHTSAHESENFQINTDTFFGKNKPRYHKSKFSGKSYKLPEEMTFDPLPEILK